VLRSPVDRLRQPAYTGADRCLPCTAVNLLFVAAGALAVGLVAPLAGGAVAVLGVGAVWLRGYVVPGTPTLTRRYLPERVLALFGKSPAAPPEGDPTERLAALGAVSGGEPTLADGFRAAWSDRAAAVADGDALRAAAGEVLSVDPGAVSVTRPQEGGVALEVDGRWVGGWPSRTALAADLATELTLAGTGWEALDRVERADLAARLRGLAEHCPVCGTATSVSEDTVTSCCGSAAVVAVSCPGCEARLAEFDPSPRAFAAGR